MTTFYFVHGSNIALPIDYTYIHYFHMNAIRLIQLGHYYIASPYYLAVKVLVSVTIQCCVLSFV